MIPGSQQAMGTFGAKVVVLRMNTDNGLGIGPHSLTGGGDRNNYPDKQPLYQFRCQQRNCYD